MFKNIPEKNRKRFFIIVFIVLPILCFISYFLASKIAKFLFDMPINATGIAFVSFVLLLGYFRGVFAAYKKLSK